MTKILSLKLLNYDTNAIKTFTLTMIKFKKKKDKEQKKSLITILNRCLKFSAAT